MNKWQKEAETSLLKSEDEAIKEIEKSYQKALKDIKTRIKALQADEMTQSKIWQLEYQKALEQQVSTIIDTMQSEQYDTISAYLTNCYQDGYCSVMYDIAKQGIPVTMPIQQDQVVKAVLTDSKLSAPLYQSMGKYLKPLKKAVSQEISRGMASSMHWNDIAANIERRTSVGYSNAIRIARTEGHRIQQSAKLDAMTSAKESGADVVKQWDSTMDKKTRPHHRELDGQIRELDEPFEVAGKKAMAPGQFGSAAEDVNCRCVVLERPRWALDEDELKTLQERAAFFGLDKANDFETFKERWMQAAKYVEKGKSPIVDSMADAYGREHANNIAEQMKDADEDVVRAWNDVQSDFKSLGKRRNAAYYTSSEDGVVLDIEEAAKGNPIYEKYEIVFHEYGHMTDYLLNRKYGDQRSANINRYKSISEVFQGLDDEGNPVFDVMSKRGLLGTTAKKELKQKLNQIKKEQGFKSVQQAKTWLINDLKSRYSLLERANLSDMLEGAGSMGGYPLGAGHGTSYWKGRDNGKEIFAEMTSASVNNHKSLECIKEVFPETYQVYKDILKVVK